MKRLPHPQKLEEYRPPVLWGTKGLRHIIAYLIFGFLLAVLTPENVLSNNPSLSRFANWMGAIVPSINPISSISSFPEVTKFFFATMWFFAPVVLAISLCKKPSLEKKFTLKELFYIVLFIPMGILISYKILTETGFRPYRYTQLLISNQ